MRAQAGSLSLKGAEWSLRGIAEWCNGTESSYFRVAGRRRLLKAALDFCCGVLAAVIAVAVVEGILPFGVGDTARFALAVGCFLVAAQTLESGYRTMWRYTSLREARLVALSCLAVFAGLVGAGWLGLPPGGGGPGLLPRPLIPFLG